MMAASSHATTTFQGRSLNRAAFQLYLDSLRDKVERQIEQVSARSPPRGGGNAYGDLVLNDDDDDSELETEIERLYAQHRQKATAGGSGSGRPGSGSRAKSASRKQPLSGLEDEDPYAHRQVQMVRPRSANLRPKKKVAPKRAAKTARLNYEDPYASPDSDMSPPRGQGAGPHGAGLATGPLPDGADLAYSENTTVGNLERQVSAQVFGGATEGAFKKALRTKQKLAAGMALTESKEEAKKPEVDAKGKGRPASAATSTRSHREPESVKMSVSRLVTNVYQEVNSLEKDVQEKIKDLNEYCEKLGWQRKYQPQYKSKLTGASRELMRVAVVDVNTEQHLRDMSVELFIKEYRKIREIFKEWERVQDGKTKKLSPRRRPAERKKETHDDIRVVLLETVQLTKKLRDQVMEMERKGGNFSPFSMGGMG